MAFEHAKQLIRERATMELDTIGTELVEDVRADISTPVEYTEFGVIRSDPGQAPRREFSNLWNSIDHIITTGESGPLLTIMAGGEQAPYARRLQFGDGKKLKPRPFFSAEILLSHVARRGASIGQRLIDAISGRG